MVHVLDVPQEKVIHQYEIIASTRCKVKEERKGGRPGFVTTIHSQPLTVAQCKHN